MKKKKFRVLDLFAGAGGFSQGLHWAGLKTTVAIDFNQKATETLTGNFGHKGMEVLQKNLFRFTPEMLKDHLRAKKRGYSFDVIVGGPPCQGWSQVGRGKIRHLRETNGHPTRVDSRNTLYRKFIKFLKYYKPRACIMENVPGMLSHDGKNNAEKVARHIEAEGYRVTWATVNASMFGVPQNRPRLIFVGIRNNLKKVFRFPFPKKGKKDKKGKKSGKNGVKLVTLREAIKDLPTIRNGARLWIRPYREPRRLNKFLRKMRRHADPRRIFDHVCREQNDQDLEAFRFLKPGGIYKQLPARLKRYRDDIFGDKYKKLRWNRPSNCVTAHLGKDCYTHIHPSQARTVSVREAARIQSFPDSFYFAGSMSDKFALIGNAVPPILAEKIGRALKRQLGEEKERQKIPYTGPIHQDENNPLKRTA